MRTAIATIGLIALLGGCEQQTRYVYVPAPTPSVPMCVSGGLTFTCEELRLAGMGIAPAPVAPLYIPPPAPVSRPTIIDCSPSGSGFLCVTIE